MKQVAGFVALLVLLVPALGCDKASPVAPEGTTLTISANPSSVQSANGTSTITVIARRANGTPVNPGTEVRFDTTLGTIDTVATTDSSGVARATLRGDGRLGKATVRASSGVATAVTVDVEVGAPARTIVLQANPTTLSQTGGTVTLLALVRDSRGQALSGVGVNFQTEIGRLGSRGGLVFTNQRGEARDTLQVSETELSNNQTGFTVTAQTAGADGALMADDFRVQVQGDRPIASFSVRRGNTAREVQFINESSGGGSLDYTWDFGDGTPVSHEENPTHIYAAEGNFTVRLTVVDLNDVSDVEIKQITVPVPN